MAAPGVILVHGFLDTGEVWRPLTARVGAAADGWLAPDLAGMGAQAADQGPHTLARHAGDLIALMDQTVGPLTLVAHSMGCQVAELAARARLDRVRALALISPVPLCGPHAPQAAVAPLAAAGGNVGAMRTVRRSLMADPPDPQTLEWLTGLGRDVRRGVAEEMVAACNEGVPDGRDPSVFKDPVLVLSGSHDRFVTPDMAAAAAARFAGASRELVPDAGHWPHAEQPEQVSRAIRAFLNAATQSPAANANTESGWTGAFNDSGDQSFAADFDPHVAFEASVLTRQVVGRERVQTILCAASRLYETLHFLHTTREGPRTFLEWEARFGGGQAVNGVTVLTSGADGKIARIAIHHRPLLAALQFSEALQTALAGKIEPDLFFSPALAAAE